MNIVRKRWKQNKQTMMMEENWIFQPDKTKDYSDFDHMEWLLRELMGLSESLAEGDSWKMIADCIHHISEEKYKTPEEEGNEEPRN